MPSDDVLWETSDPNGRTVRLLSSTAGIRERMGKHADASHMTTDEARQTVESPHIIQQSMTDDARESYYRYDTETGKPPYKRVTVVVDSEDGATAISWGRQGKLPAHETTVWIRKRR